jgi:hypothetical protein
VHVHVRNMWVCTCTCNILCVSTVCASVCEQVVYVYKLMCASFCYYFLMNQWLIYDSQSSKDMCLLKTPHGRFLMFYCPHTNYPIFIPI